MIDIPRHGSATLSVEQLEEAMQEWVWLGTPDALADSGPDTTLYLVSGEHDGYSLLEVSEKRSGTSAEPDFEVRRLPDRMVHGSMLSHRGNPTTAYHFLMKRFPELGEEFLLPHLSSDDELTASWARYNLKENHGWEDFPETVTTYGDYLRLREGWVLIDDDLWDKICQTNNWKILRYLEVLDDGTLMTHVVTLKWRNVYKTRLQDMEMKSEPLTSVHALIERMDMGYEQAHAHLFGRAGDKAKAFLLALAESRDDKIASWAGETLFHEHGHGPDPSRRENRRKGGSQLVARIAAGADAGTYAELRDEPARQAVTDDRRFQPPELLAEERDAERWHCLHLAVYADLDVAAGRELARCRGGFIVRSFRENTGAPEDDPRRKAITDRTFCAGPREVYDVISNGDFEQFHTLLGNFPDLSAELLKLWRREDPGSVPGTYLGMLPDARGGYVEGEFWLEKREDGSLVLLWQDFPDDADVDETWEFRSEARAREFLIRRGVDAGVAGALIPGSDHGRTT